MKTLIHFVISFGGLILLLGCHKSMAGLLADYQFNDTLASDVVSAPDVVDLGAPTAYESGYLSGRPTRAITMNQGSGLKLSLSEWQLCSGYSIVLKAKVDSLSWYRKLIDFSDLLSDSGVYTHATQVFFENNHSEVSAQEGVYFQLIVTREANSLVKIYLNGSHLPQITYTDSNGIADLCTGADDLYFFLDDTVTNNEHPSGAVDRLMIYDHVLSDTEVLNLVLFDVIWEAGFEGLNQN